jgi:translation initiation factor IF-3
LKGGFKGRRRPQRIEKKSEHRINEDIRAQKVRVVGENLETGVYSLKEALELADEQGLDLVEIAPKADPPVCKVIDYSKFLYDKKKKEKEIKAKAAKTVIKEIRFTPNTDEHDLDFKTNHAIAFLKEGAKVKAYIQFKGRTILFKERGELLLLKFVKNIEEYGILEQMPKLEGKRMIIFVAPKQQKK